LKIMITLPNQSLVRKSVALSVVSL